jgi:hypothetical protein
MALHSDTASREAAEAGMIFCINLIDFIKLDFQIPIVFFLKPRIIHRNAKFAFSD